MHATARIRPQRRAHEREGFRPDRAGLWAVLLGIVVLLVAATSSHAAIRQHASSSVSARAAALQAPPHAVAGARRAGPQR
jgi:hypothetical protein